MCVQDKYGTRLVGACGPKQKQTSGGAESRENFIVKLVLSYHLEVIKILTLSA